MAQHFVAQQSVSPDWRRQVANISRKVFDDFDDSGNPLTEFQKNVRNARRMVERILGKPLEVARAMVAQNSIVLSVVPMGENPAVEGVWNKIVVSVAEGIVLRARVAADGYWEKHGQAEQEAWREEMSRINIQARFCIRFLEGAKKTLADAQEFLTGAGFVSLPYYSSAFPEQPDYIHNRIFLQVENGIVVKARLDKPPQQE